MTQEVAIDPRFDEALAAVERAVDKMNRSSDEEKSRLRRDLDDLRSMQSKLLGGRVEIIVFGEISTGKSALVNSLVGREVTQVNVRGGWTKETTGVEWDASGYAVPGLSKSQVVLIDTPGINEVGGDARAEIAREAAKRADLILFVTDSDLNDTEHDAIMALADVHKPIIIILNKIDLYTPDQRTQLLDILLERLKDVVPSENIVLAAADPREVEYVIESADGSTRNEWRKPEADNYQVKARILEVLEQDGLALLALNAAMYAADKNDRIAKLRIELRDRKANQAIWSFAGFKALAVALNPVPGFDVVGGTAVDVTMVGTLAHIYGLEMSWMHARQLVSGILKAAGWMLAVEAATSYGSSIFKALTVGYGTMLTAVPQGAAAGYGSYIVGQAAKYYFEHGASWGSEAPKVVVQRILEQTDKQSVLESLKKEIRLKMERNVHTESSE